MPFTTFINNLLRKLLKIEIIPYRKHKSVRDYISSNKSGNYFEDESGKKYQLITGLKNFLKPDWRSMFNQPKFESPSQSSAKKNLAAADRDINYVLDFLTNFNFHPNGKKALEIGCYDGSKTIALKNKGFSSVVGSDEIKYYIDQTPTKESTQLEEQYRSFLNELRQTYLNLTFPEKKMDESINFIEDDIQTTSLSSDSFDFILSWACLEHFANPQKSIANIYKILKPGGITLHQYNPFFALDGGHSLCTTDIPWGHVVLTERGFEKYFQELRPKETELSLSFYKNNLNRMTFRDLTRSAEECGFKTIFSIPFTNPDYLTCIGSDLLTDVEEKHPTIDLLDLISNWILIAFKKPV